MVRFTETSWQRICVASLIGHCKAILKSDLLGPDSEESLRVLLDETICAFNLQHNQEFAA